MTGPGGLPDWDFGAVPGSPAAIVPVPACADRSPRGQRVIVGIPGLGWRMDLRGDAPVVRGSRTYIPVLPELEWYRAETERVEVFAPLIPIERVWLETLGPTAAAPEGADLISRLVSLDAPPTRAPIPARDVARLTGRRVVRVPGPAEKAATEQRDLRALTEPHTSADGDICVRVTKELDWYQWTWKGQAPPALTVPIHLLWAE